MASKRFSCLSSRLASRLSSAGYVAPEVLQGRPYTEKIDSWSLGVILYELLSARMPFEGDTDMEVMSKAVRGCFDFRCVRQRGTSGV